MRLKLTGCFLAATLAVSYNAFAQYGGIASNLYENARRGNYGAIQRIIDSGYSIDTTDANGNTALCMALMHRDSYAYSFLRKFGADSQHVCTRYLQGNTYASRYSGSGFEWKPAYTVGAVALLGGAGVAAALAGGGGGGGGSHHSSGGGDDPGGGGGSGGGDDPGGGGDDPGGGGGSGGESGIISDKEIVTPLNSSFFETDEYKKGNFLSKINASKAYARFYGLDEDGNMATQLNRVMVGVIDTGIYADNADFATTITSGFNSDYGPCLNGDNKNCWKYSGGKVYFSEDSSQYYTMSQADYNTWVAEYSSNYNWDNNKDNFFPERGTSNMHGTHVAGIIGADKNSSGMHGVAFSNAVLLGGRWDFMSRPGDVISKMVDEGAQVINMSFGLDARVYPATDLNDDYYSQYRTSTNNYIVSGVLKAANNNVVMVMSAGNESQTQPGLYNGMPNLTALNGALNNLFVTVVATGSDGSIANYSNACGVAKNYCIAAPGGDSSSKIWSTGTYDVTMYGSYGTSMAAPVVSGSIALLMGAYPYLTPQQIVSLIFESANKSGIYANKDLYGNGMLDLAAATNPQGYLGTISSTDADSSVVNINSSRIVVPSVFKEALQNNMPKTMAVFDKYKRPFNIKFDSMVQTTHSGHKNFKNDLYNFSRHQPKKTVSDDSFAFAYAPSSYSNNDGGIGIADVSYKDDNAETSFFFAENSLYSSGDYNDKAMYNPYLAMNDAYGVAHKMYWDDNLSFKMSFMTGENGLYDGDRNYHDYNFDNRSYAFNTEVSYQVTPKFNVTAMTGMLAEDDALLGMNGRGALSIGDSNTYYAGLMLEWQPFENWSFGGAYYHGWTDASKVYGSMISTSQLMSDSFALDGHYNINKTDVVGLQISSPLRIYNGHADFDIATGRDNYSNEVYREKIRANLKPSSREYKFALYHNREITDSVLFKSEFAVRLHPEHQKDAETDYRAMFGLSWAF